MSGQEGNSERRRTPGVGQLASELRSLRASDGEHEFTHRLLRVAEHLEAHERSLFRQREALRDQLLAVRAEIARERKLIEEARAIRLGSVPPRRESTPPIVTATHLPSARALIGTEPSALRKKSPGRVRKAARRPTLTPPLRPTVVPEERIAEPPVAPSLVPNPVALPLPRDPVARTEAERPRRLAAPPPPAEIIVPIGPGNLVSVGLALAVVLVLFGWSSVDRWNAHRSNMALARTLDDPSATADQVWDALAARRESRLTAADGAGAYLVARALARVESQPNDDLVSRSTGEERVGLKEQIDRAAWLAPANIWIRLSQAHLAELASEKETSVALWRSLTSAPIVDPAFREAVADHWERVGEREWALATYGAVMQQRPERTGPVLTRLAANGLKRRDYLALVPQRPRAILEATRFLKDSGHSDWWTYPTKLLSPIAETIATETSSEVEAAVRLAELVGATEPAVAILASAVGRFPERRDWRLLLARFHFETKDFERSELLARAVLEADAAGGDETQAAARALLDKIELASGGARRGPAAN